MPTLADVVTGSASRAEAAAKLSVSAKTLYNRLADAGLVGVEMALPELIARWVRENPAKARAAIAAAAAIDGVAGEVRPSAHSLRDE